MAEKRPPLPLILTANDLIEGLTVYRTAAGGWSRAIEDALVATDEPGAAALDEVRAEAARGTAVVDPYLAGVTLAGGVPVPLHYRERFRLTGPSFRDDFGRNPAPRT